MYHAWQFDAHQRKLIDSLDGRWRNGNGMSDGASGASANAAVHVESW
eukprot:SAG31_NODE_187_length_20848_cov_22.521953_7_plen_47_part_00